MTSKLTVTKEQIIALIAEHSYDSSLVDALEHLLAALDSEPVAYMYDGEDGREYNGHNEFSGGGKGIPLYRHAQPAPVVPKKATVGEMPFLGTSEGGYVRGWNDCRAAMLQAGNYREIANSSTNNCREIPETSTRRSCEHFISLCNEFWNWSEMDLVCADDRGYELRMEWDGDVFKHPVTQALWRMYQAAAGNSPVIPDRWIPVSERMPEDAQWCLVNTEYGYHVQCWSKGQGWLGDEISIPNCDVTHWMPLPAAPQEVKS